MKTISITIPSVPKNIRIIESFVDNVKEDFNLSDDLYGNIMISVTEAANNAIKHGNQNNANKNVSLTLSVEERQIKFSIEDEGRGFDYENLPDPTAPENIEKTYGRGVFLMERLSDKITFKEGGKQIELIFYTS